MTRGPRRARRAPVVRGTLATAAATAATLGIYAGPTPGPVSAVVRGNSVTSVVVFAVLLAGALWTLRTTSRSVWPWAVGVGVAFATANLAGVSIRTIDSFGMLVGEEDRGWAVVHGLGVAALAVFALAALFHRVERYVQDRARPSEPDDAGVLTRLVGSLRSADRSRRGRGVLVVLALLLLSRVPYLLVWWPGIVYFDTFRAYSYARGTKPWSTYDPVGHSLLITAEQWLGTQFGLGDAGGVAIATSVQVLTTTGALTFMLVRLAAWGLGRRLWAAAFAWCLFLPVFGMFSVSVDKDVPFASTFLVFLVCVAEIVFGPGSAEKRWPWVALAVTGILAVVLRNNGVHAVLLSLALLFIPLRHRWRPLLLTLVATVVGYGLYVGPVYWALDVRPGPGEEAYSIPLQQLGRIAKEDQATLTPDERMFLAETFKPPPEELAQRYVPWLADPMKLNARPKWHQHSPGEFLSGWFQVATDHPGTAVEATLANTLGYWAPGTPSYDGFLWWSRNGDSRAVHLDIPSGEPTEGLRDVVVHDSGFVPTRVYRTGLQPDDGYLGVPVLGLLMTPSFVLWLWLVAVVPVLRRRAWTALAVFIPPAALLLTFLAGPVSGGQRYTLSFFNALPVALAAMVLARPRGLDVPERAAEQGAARERRKVDVT